MTPRAGISLLIFLLALLPSPTKQLQQPRFAIIISGQLRTANLTWDQTIQNPKFFGAGDPPTPARTCIEWLFKPLIKQGFSLDVFMYLTSPYPPGASDAVETRWNGDPSKYQPRPGDTRGCQLFSDPSIFNGSTTSPHRFFCLVEQERQLLTPLINKNPIWEDYAYTYLHHRHGEKWHVGHDPYLLREQALQQLYGHYKANKFAKQFALANSFKYTYKLRTRPDIALTQPFPVISNLTLSFIAPKRCSATQRFKVIYHSKIFGKPGSLQDIFNFGRPAEMDILLDRYVDLTEGGINAGNADSSVDSNRPALLRGKKWKLEDHLTSFLTHTHWLCFTDAPSIWAVVTKELKGQCRGAYGCVSARPKRLDLEYWWSDLSGHRDHELANASSSNLVSDGNISADTTATTNTTAATTAGLASASANASAAQTNSTIV